MRFVALRRRTVLLVGACGVAVGLAIALFPVKQGACAPACAIEGDLGLDDIIAAHRAGVEQLHTIDLTGEQRRRDDGSLIMSFRWTKSGSRERYRTTSHWMAGASRFADWFLDGSQMSLLYAYDPDDPPDIRPYRQHGVTATIR
ncbi:MAG: hypothetical protein HYS13_15210, partial [Planctomycetia bacterium]|nr:hypothetical protein [Planctomycetia bacterium]